MGEAVTDDFDRLLAAHLDDTLDAAETARFHEHLRSDAQARQLLLAASTQASALPRLGLEESAVQRPLPVSASASPRGWWLPLATAATLLVGALSWWSLSQSVSEVRVAGGRIERAGVAQPAGTTLRAGDRLVGGTAATVLSWPGEDTRLDLTAGSSLRVEELGVRKVVRLEQGGLEAVVAAQPTDGGLTIVTPHGRVEVIGTRFEVQVQERGSRVAVTHGRVRVSPSSGGPAVMIEAGYAAELTPGAISSPGPAMALPPVASVPLPAVSTGPTLRITAVDFTAGSEGRVAGGVVHGVPIADGRVTRLTTAARRPTGYARLGDHLRCTVRLSVDRPTTLALLLVCDQPDGEAMWVGNLQAERAIPAGTHEVVFTRADLRLATGAMPAVGSRLIAASVMCWGEAADLRLEWLAFDE